MSYDIAIIGSGVIGLFIAYELAHYRVRVLVIDREVEPGFGVSKGHAGVIHVVQPPFNSLRSNWPLRVIGCMMTLPRDFTSGLEG